MAAILEQARARRLGRAQALSWLLLVPALVLVAAATFLAVRGESGRAAAPLAETKSSDAVRVFTVEFDHGEHGEQRVLVRLGPLHGEAPLQAHEAEVLARRFALPSGEPWRLELSGLEAVRVDGAAVEDGRGQALAPLADWLNESREPGAIDPLRALLGAGGARLADGTRSILLWGRPPEGEPELAVDFGSGARTTCALVPEEVACGSLPRHLARLGAQPADAEQQSGLEPSER